MSETNGPYTTAGARHAYTFVDNMRDAAPQDERDYEVAIQPRRLLSGAEAAISPVSFWVPEYICPSSAWVEHAPFAFWICAALRPRRFVELGTHYGYSYFAFCQAIDRLGLGTVAYAVDTWQGDEHAGFFGEEVFHSVAGRGEPKYAAFSSLVRSTFEEALEYFADGSVDLLHIDGRHFYEDVKRDFTIWRRKLTDDAVVLFNDTNVRGAQIWRMEILCGARGAASFFSILSRLRARCPGTRRAHSRANPSAISHIVTSCRSDPGRVCALGGALTTRSGLEQLRTDIEQRVAAEAALRSEIQQRVAAEAALRGEIEQRVAAEAALRGEIEQRVAAEAALRAEIEQRVAAEATLRTESEALIGQNAALSGELSEGRIAAAALKGECDRLRYAIQRFEIKKVEAASVAEAMSAEIANVRLALSAAQLQAEQRATANGVLEAEIRRVRVALAEQQKNSEVELSALRDQIGSLESQLAVARDVGRRVAAFLRSDVALTPAKLPDTGFLVGVLRFFGLQARHPLPLNG